MKFQGNCAILCIISQSCVLSKNHYLNFIAGRQGDILLTGNCEGGLEIYTTAPSTGEGFHKICDANFGDEEAEVVCRQAGCNTARARRISGR